MEGCRRRTRAARYLRCVATSVARPAPTPFLVHYHREIDKRKGRSGAHQARKSRRRHPSITLPPAFTLPTPLRTGRSDFKLIGQSFFIVQNSSRRHSKWSHNFRALIPQDGYEDRQRRGDPHIHFQGCHRRALCSIRAPRTGAQLLAYPRHPGSCAGAPLLFPPHVSPSFHRASL